MQENTNFENEHFTEEVTAADTAVDTEAHKYDESQIQVLEGLEAVRKRPGMYIGSTSEKGLHHLIYEIVTNSIDEALAGICDRIIVTLHEDNSISVLDNGRGIPAGIHPKMGIPTLEVVFTVLHAGGKFGGDGYKISGGLHGVGASVVNALSEWTEIVNCHDGKKYTERFERGKVARPMVEEGETDKHGLYVRFKPDAEIFDEIVVKYNTVLSMLREQAFLNAGLAIELVDLRPETHENVPEITEYNEDEEDTDGDGFEHEFDEEGVAPEDAAPKKEKKVELLYEGGIRSFVEHLNAKKHANLLHEDVIYVSGKKDDTREIAMQYNDKYDETIFSFANNVRTMEGGTHETGFKNALTKILNDYARKFGYLKADDKNLMGEDVRDGLPRRHQRQTARSAV